MDASPASPRIEALRAAMSRGDAAALDTFWRRLEVEGAPIVEPIAGDGAHRLVTFVYRATEPRGNVSMIPGLERAGDPASNMLDGIGDTDAWYRTYVARSDLRTMYQFSPDDPLRSLADMSIDEIQAYQAERMPHWAPDALNPLALEIAPGLPASSIVELPDAPPQPYLAKRDGVPEGTIVTEDIGRDPLGEGRRTWTYLPPGYDAARGPFPLIVYFDGWIGRKLGVHTTLDNLIADGRIPPSVCVMVHQLDRMKELACNDTFADWLATDFMAWVRKRYAITNDPARTVATGMSLGGLGAAHCALRHPGVFGNVLSQSGSFWWFGETHGEHAWLTHQFEARERLPVRWYAEVGLLEDMARPGGIPTMIDANREFRDVLRAKGYDVRYEEYNGGHDYVCWRGSIADGLTYLLGT
jgi:enterochelin esterase family protein